MTGEHGYTAYTRGCRCSTCAQAKRTYAADARAAARRRRELVEAGGGRYVASVIVHGYAAYQNAGCRCDVCRAAKRERDHDRYLRILS